MIRYRFRWRVKAVNIRKGVQNLACSLESRRVGMGVWSEWSHSCSLYPVGHFVEGRQSLSTAPQDYRTRLVSSPLQTQASRYRSRSHPAGSGREAAGEVNAESFQQESEMRESLRVQYPQSSRGILVMGLERDTVVVKMLVDGYQNFGFVGAPSVWIRETMNGGKTTRIKS